MSESSDMNLSDNEALSEPNPTEQTKEHKIICKSIYQIDKQHSSNFNAVVTGVLIALVPACIGYGVTFLNELRKNNLNFTNKQIEKLYGPLFSLTLANEATWNQFARTVMHNDGRSVYFNYDTLLSKEQTNAWRSWMKTVFQPLNQKIEDTIQHNAQLIVGDKLPNVFTRVSAHIEAYKGIIATWTDDDQNRPDYGSITRNTVVGLNYPDEFTKCVGDTLSLLKKRQQDFQRWYIAYPWTSNDVDSPDSCK